MTKNATATMPIIQPAKIIGLETGAVCEVVAINHSSSVPKVGPGATSSLPPPPLCSPSVFQTRRGASCPWENKGDASIWRYRKLDASPLCGFIAGGYRCIVRDPAVCAQAVSAPDPAGEDGGGASVGESRAAEARAALAAFDPAWPALTPQAQARVVDLLVQPLDYDGARETGASTFHAARMHALAKEWAEPAQER